MTDSIIPSWQDVAERWLKAYEEAKAELEAAEKRAEELEKWNALLTPLHGYNVKLKARAEAAEARVRELEGALVRLIEFVEDDTCRHDEEKAGPLLIARAALSGKAGT